MFLKMCNGNMKIQDKINILQYAQFHFRQILHEHGTNSVIVPSFWTFFQDKGESTN